MTSISAPSDFEPQEWAAPWRIDRPIGPRPPHGSERDAWLEQRLLFQSATSLKSVLDRIDPAIARNEPVANIDEDAVTTALLEFLQPTLSDNTSDSTKKRISVKKAHAFLCYFKRGFKHYCHTHNLRQPRLPLAREYSPDEGSLQAGTFGELREYRRSAARLIDAIEQILNSLEPLNGTPANAAALLVCSSALFGGLSREAHWKAFAEALTSPIQRYGEVFAFRFDKPSPYRWIADPITEALLRRLLRCGLLPLEAGTTVSPSQIRRILFPEIASNMVLKHLTDIVEAAHVRHFAPDVAAVAEGKIYNTPLAEEPWRRVISGTRHHTPRATTALAIPKIRSTAQASTLQQGELLKIIESIWKALRWNTEERHIIGSPISRKDEPAVRKYYSKAHDAIKTAQKDLERLYARSGHPEGHRTCFTYGLICYVTDLLELGGTKVRTLAPSSISSYFGIIRTHLSALTFADLVELGTEARADIYVAAIREQHVQKRKSHRTAFEGFERSILRHIDLIDEVDWGHIPGEAKNSHLPSVDANLVDPELYQYVFKSLETPAQHSPIVELSRVLLIILYRFGLRTGEAAEVTAGALMLNHDGEAILRVSASTLTSRKSVSALRQVGPIKLPADEMKVLSEYQNRCMGKAAQHGRDRLGAYLFGSGPNNSLEHVAQAQQLLIQALRTASGDTLLRPRHLRHSFVSRLFLDGRTPMNRGDHVNSEASEDAWYRAFATGHASPDTGIVSYTHVVELAHYHYSRQLVGAEAPLPFLSRLAGNDNRSLERKHLRHATTAPTDISLYLESLHRNFPCPDILDALANRTGYQEIEFRQITEVVSSPLEPLSWKIAWEIYANARVRATTTDISEQAHSIRMRTRFLEIRERLANRSRRRPHLSLAEAAAAPALWQMLFKDRELQNLIRSAADCLRPTGDILMPAETARYLERWLVRGGLTRIELEEAKLQRIKLTNRDKNGRVSTSWLELIGFLYAGCPDGESTAVDL